MGCDTHIYIEYRQKNRAGVWWRNYGGRINPGRNYQLFGMMAGVRCQPAFSYEPKGMPHDAASTTTSDNRLFISDSNGEGYATLEQAEAWAKSGSSNIIFHGDKPTWVTHPDWHSHSWLSAQEFKALLNTYYKGEVGLIHPEPEYEVLLACLLKFEELGYSSRIVFWFDN